ncbi:hypothetical protein ACTID9_11840 [Brevibacillus fluminis]|uniref:hypothetical protein n=1 Tax=Brevibacillus fluminis TaxID=511487 RepID=UPI003F8CB795
MSCRRRHSRTRVFRTNIAEIRRSGNVVAGAGGTATGGTDGVAVSTGGEGENIEVLNILSKNSLGGFAAAVMNVGSVNTVNNQNNSVNTTTAATTTTQAINSGPISGGINGLAIGGDASSNTTGGIGGAGGNASHQSNGGNAAGGDAKAKIKANAKPKAKSH